MPIKLNHIAVFSLKEISNLLKTREDTIIDYIRKGEIRARKLEGIWYISEDSLREFFLYEPSAEELFEDRNKKTKVSKNKTESTINKAGFGYSSEKWSGAKKSIKDVLIKTCKNNDLTTYSSLLSIMPSYGVLHTILSEISTEEYENGRGLLGSVVVNSKSNTTPVPDGEFFDCAKKLGLKPGDEEKEQYYFWKDMLEETRKNWSEL